MRFTVIELLLLVISELYFKSDCNIAKKIVLQNEMSEYCRRHVVSSIFLGRQVADSSAEVMHFSRLDLPYSCSISVRTQSGSNIVLVILSESERNLMSSCSNGHDQLLIYEMGETFGGYWAPLPKSVFEQETQNRTTYYTLKTTKAASHTLDFGATDHDIVMLTDEIVSETTPHEETEDGYIVMEVPIVNVSGDVQLDETESTSLIDQNELFDLIYDVTPKNGVLYETSVIPLVQFSILKQNGQKEDLDVPRYQLDFNVNEFTLDSRLKFRTNNYRRKFRNRPYPSTRRLKFRKQSKEFFAVNNWTGRIHRHKEYITNLYATTLLNKEKATDYNTYKNHSDTWQLIEEYLKLLSVDNSTISPDLDDEALALLKRISNMKHNASVYLQSNFSKFNESYPSSNVRKKNVITKKIMSHTTRSSSNTLPFRNINTQQNDRSINTSIMTNMSMGKVKSEISTESMFSTTKSSLREVTTAMSPSITTQKDRFGIKSTPVSYSQLPEKVATTEKLESGSLVDHESWENIVQVAPVMADLLNVTTALNPKSTTVIPKKITEPTFPITAENKIHRKKRYIQALSVDKHRPRQITTKEQGPTNNQNKRQFGLHHLAALVELEDDEIQGRVALHYFKNYAGPKIFNMCDFTEPKARQVFLFNSSRIVIAVSNFTMDRLTLVMTESRLAYGLGCPPAHVECQVNGVRVCVHTMNSCDGVPNCGAYDIYDEDRLMCGHSAGFHYTVWLAACTFLVVLLTVLYSVHYWLQRCIPKVSEAFFVYTDKSENILHLETIMRSPNDIDGDSRLVYHSSFYSEDDLSTESTKLSDRKVMNIISRCIRILCCRNKTKDSDHPKEDNINEQDVPYNIYSEPKRKFSFTEMELRKIGPKPTKTRNTSIQTGDSLEKAHLKNIKSVDSYVTMNKLLRKENSNSIISMINLQESERELSSLRQIRGISATLQSTKNISDKNLAQSTDEHSVNAEEEVELRSTMYENVGKRHGLKGKVTEMTKYDIHSEPPKEKRQAAKHLRFDEEAMTIEPSEAFLDDDNNVFGHRTRKIHAHPDRIANKYLYTIEEDEGAASTSGRDFRRFWGKGKKNKKKTQLPLRQRED